MKFRSKKSRTDFKTENKQVENQNGFTKHVLNADSLKLLYLVLGILNTVEYLIGVN